MAKKNNNTALYVLLGIIGVLIVWWFLTRGTWSEGKHPPHIPRPPIRGQQPEVFFVSAPGIYQDQGADVCSAHGAVLANLSQMQQAYDEGADWCAPSVISDSQNSYWPIQTPNQCGPVGLMSQPIFQEGDPATSGAACYGIKPAKGTTSDVQAFNWTTGQWSMRVIYA